MPIWDSDERRAAMRAGGDWEQQYQRLPFPESLPQASRPSRFSALHRAPLRPSSLRCPSLLCPVQARGSHRRRRLQVSGRYTSTLEALREAAPYALLVTHGFGVQAMAEHASEGKEIEEPAYCSLTRMRRLGEEDWSCDLICRADHLAGEAGGTAAKGSGGGGPIGTIAFSAASF